MLSGAQGEPGGQGWSPAPWAGLPLGQLHLLWPSPKSVQMGIWGVKVAGSCQSDPYQLSTERPPLGSGGTPSHLPPCAQELPFGSSKVRIWE